MVGDLIKLLKSCNQKVETMLTQLEQEFNQVVDGGGAMEEDEEGGGGSGDGDESEDEDGDEEN